MTWTLQRLWISVRTDDLWLGNPRCPATASPRATQGLTTLAKDRAKCPGNYLCLLRNKSAGKSYCYSWAENKARLHHAWAKQSVWRSASSACHSPVELPTLSPDPTSQETGRISVSPPKGLQHSLKFGQKQTGEGALYWPFLTALLFIWLEQPLSGYSPHICLFWPHQPPRMLSASPVLEVTPELYSLTLLMLCVPQSHLIPPLPLSF